MSQTFWRHVLSHFTAPLFAHHDPENVEIYCYAGDVRPDVDEAYRFREPRIVWRDGVPRDDVALAERIRSDGVDILVDLNLHMAEGRVRAFACRPAPVQITWLGYPGTTGLSAMDYRITDPHIDPPEVLASEPYAERSLALPDAFWCYDPRASELSVSTLPALENGSVTFGCLNGLWKINPGVVGLWAKVLSAIPGSRLVLVGPGARAAPDASGTNSAERRVLELFREQGVSEGRIEFVPRASRREYLSYYQGIDIGLDTLPYNGHTTSLDAFFMGVPVVTLIGDRVVGRAGLCFAENLELPGLVARSPGEFVEIAQKLCANLDALAELRAGLRRRLHDSPLMDAARFARNLEAIYRRVWREWCAAPRRT